MPNKAFDESNYTDWIDPEKTIPYEHNAKIHTEKQIKNICNSIRRFGWQQDTVITSDNVLVIGHGRREAAIRLGCKMPFHRVDKTADELTEEDIRELRIADNQTNAETGLDLDELKIELEDLSFDGFDFDFDGLEMDEEQADAIEDDYEAAPPEEPKAKLGNIYQLGQHRLMCGDSTNQEDIEKLINGADVDLLLTDPPYGISVVKGNKVGGTGKTHFGKVGGENIVQSSTYMEVKGDETTETAEKNYVLTKDLTKNQIIFGGNYFTDFLFPSRCWIVWDKQNTGNFADAELAWTSFDRGVKLYHYMWNGLAREGERSVEGIHRVHPTQKPVGMLSYILTDFTEEGETVLDCFGGSGSTLIACEQTGRKCLMMEYEPHYIDVIIDRWETFTGKKAALLT